MVNIIKDENLELAFDRDLKRVVKVYGWKSIEDIPKDKIIPFITISERSKEEEAILRSWEKHFRGMFNGIQLIEKYRKPYCITHNPITQVKKLWIK